MSGPHRFTADAGPTEAHLRLISLSDLHMRLMPYDYIADQPVTGQSLALAAAEAELARKEALNALLFDIGDAYEGSPIDDVLATAPPSGGHPMSAALQAAGLDAATLGNHDFDRGLSPVKRIIAEAPVPLTLANIVRALGPTPLDDTPLAPTTLLLERPLTCGDGAARPIKIGLIGVAPPQTLAWNGDALGGQLASRDIVETVAAWAPDLRRRGADVVIVLCHSGIGSARATPMMEHAAVPVAALDTVDVVLSGHAHDLFPAPDFAPPPSAVPASANGPGKAERIDPAAGMLHGKPTTMPGVWGSHIGLVDLRLSYDAGGGWRVTESAASLRSVTRQRPHPGVVAAAAAHHAETLRHVARPVTQNSRAFSTYFAHIADVPALQIVNAAQADAVADALRGRPEAALPILSATAPLKAGGQRGAAEYTDVPAGTLLMRHVVDLYVYQNTLAALRLTGAQLKDWLERSASVFQTVVPGALRAPLLDPAHPSYAFDVVSGVTYRIDLSREPLFDAVGTRLRPHDCVGRIVELRHAGRPIAPDDAFVLATNSYRLGGGCGFPVSGAAPLSLGGPIAVRDVLLAYLKAGGADRALPPPAWGFARLPGTRVMFDLPKAARTALPGDRNARSPAVVRVGEGDGDSDRYALDLARAGQMGPA